MKEENRRGKTKRVKKYEQLYARIDLMEREIRRLKEIIEGITNKASVVVVHNCAEPPLLNTKVRIQTDWAQARNVLRLSELPATIPFTKVHRIGTWKEGPNRDPRTLLIGFTNPRPRDLLLSRAEKVCRNSGGMLKVTPEGCSPLRVTNGFAKKNIKDGVRPPVVRMTRLEVSQPKSRNQPISRSTPRAGTSVVSKVMAGFHLFRKTSELPLKVS